MSASRKPLRPKLKDRLDNPGREYLNRARIRVAPSFEGLRPASPTASVSKRQNRARDTTPELILRKSLSAIGIRYRLHAADLPGNPDIVFRREKVAIFCDGDFWHGKHWKRRKAKLALGHNGLYWVAKIQTNIDRDRRNRRVLRRQGWRVLRFWESEIRQCATAVGLRISLILEERRSLQP